MRTVLAAGAVVIALAIGVGAFAAYRMVFTSSAHPEASLPASVLAYASLDFDPGLGQQAQLISLARKFPKIADAGDPAKWISNFFSDADIKNLDVERDLASWLGLRVGVGLWLDAGDKPFALVAAESRDDNEAKAGLARVRTALKDVDLGYQVKDGTALIAIGERKAQEAVTAAAADAAKASLTANQTFTANRGWLPDDEVLTLWLDLDGIAKAMEAMVPEELEGALDAQFTQFNGTAIVGARAVATGLEIKSRSFGGGAGAPLAVDPLTTVGGLPGGTVVGGSLGVPDIAEGAGGALGMLGLFGGTAMTGFPPGLTGLTAPGGPIPEDLAGLDPDDPEFGEGFAEAGKFAKLQQAIVNGLSNSAVTLAVSGADRAKPGISIEAVVADKAGAKALHDAIVALGSKDFKARLDGTKVSISTTAYAAGSGMLSANPLFGKATEGGPDRRSAVLFVDVPKLDLDSPDLAAVKAIGVVAGSEGDDSVTVIHIIVE